MVEKNESIQMLRKLLDWEAGAIHFYKGILKDVRDEFLRMDLCIFQDDHCRHHHALLERLISLDVSTVIKDSTRMDLKAVILEAYAQIVKWKRGDIGCLEALLMDEKRSIKIYEACLKSDLSQDLRLMVHEYLEDEHYHLECVQGALNQYYIEQKLWRK